MTMPHTITERDMGFVRLLAARHYSDADDYEETVADGMLGLVQAAQRFDPNHGAKFTTYAASRIQGAMTDGKRERDPLSRRDRTRDDARGDEMRSRAAGAVSLNAPVVVDDGGECDLSAVIADPEAPDPLDVLLAREAHDTRRKVLAEAVAKLPDRQRNVIARRYYMDHNGRQVAEAIGISIGTAWSHQTLATRKLRRTLDRDALAA